MQCPITELKPGNVFILHGSTYIFACKNPPHAVALVLDTVGIVRGYTLIALSVVVETTENVVVVLPKEVVKYIKESGYK